MLLAENGSRWLRELGLRADQGHFVRGMVEEVEAPFRQLALSSTDSSPAPKGAEALASPERLRHLRALDLAMNDVRDSGVRALASMPKIAALRQLCLIADTPH